MNIIKRLSVAVAGLGLSLALFAAVPAGAQGAPAAPAAPAQTAQQSVCEGVAIATGESCDATGPGGAETKVNEIIRLVVNTLGFIVGIVAVIMIIIGGLKYITSSGDSNNITSAKNTILYAIIGLVIVALSQVIVRFVLNKAA